MSRLTIAFRYAVCAAAATLLNLVAQWLTFRIYPEIRYLALGLVVGTAIGLMSKYVLDKVFIFDDASLGLLDNLHKFTFYCITGIITTAIFWGAEIVFALANNAVSMRYVGALVGLSIGYFTKYHLDRRFVFRVAP
jgi:hypothetical protein